MTLFECNINQEVKVIHVSGVRNIRKRLIDMGITTNTIVKIIRKAPFGDPIEIKIRGYSLSLRMDEAKNIMVEVI